MVEDWIHWFGTSWKMLLKSTGYVKPCPTCTVWEFGGFQAILVESKAIKLHPLGYVRPSMRTSMETRCDPPSLTGSTGRVPFLCAFSNNYMKPSTVVWLRYLLRIWYWVYYYLTRKGRERRRQREGMLLQVYQCEAILAYREPLCNPCADRCSQVKKILTGEDGSRRKEEGIIETTVGRLLFNEIIPQDFGIYWPFFTGESFPSGNQFPSKEKKKKNLKQILEKVMDVHGAMQTL